MPKLYQFTINEHNGEQEYDHTVYVLADNLRQAKSFARKYASHWYPDAERDPYVGGWSMDFGAVAWRVEMVTEAQSLRIEYEGAGENQGGGINVDLNKLIEAAQA